MSERTRISSSRASEGSCSRASPSTVKWSTPAFPGRRTAASPSSVGSRKPSRRMTMIVFDAPVLAPALADDGDDGDRPRNRLRGEPFGAPSPCRPRGCFGAVARVSGQTLDERRSAQAPGRPRAGATSTGGTPLVARSSLGEVRDNVTVYDGAYGACRAGKRAAGAGRCSRVTRAPASGARSTRMSDRGMGREGPTNAVRRPWGAGTVDICA